MFAMLACGWTSINPLFRGTFSTSKKTWTRTRSTVNRGHGARLAEVGRAFLRDVREMFDNLDHAKTAALAVASSKRGRLRLAASDDVITGTLACIITAYQEQRPEVRLDLLEMPAVAQGRALQRGRIDLGLMLPPIEGAAILYRHATIDPPRPARREDQPPFPAAVRCPGMARANALS